MSIRGHIKYLDFSNGDWVYAYLINIDEKYAYICDQFSYHWLVFINKEDWIDKMNSNRINKDFFQYKYLLNHTYKPYSDSFFDFPLSENDMLHFHGISEFFKAFMFSRNLSIVEKIDYSIKRTHFWLSQQTIDKIVRYMIKKYENTNDRLELLLSPAIQKYLL